MKLKAYLDRPGVTASGLARKVGVSHSTILRLASGEQRPAFDTLERIHAATEGEVAPNDFLLSSDIPGRAGEGDGSTPPLQGPPGEPPAIGTAGPGPSANLRAEGPTSAAPVAA